MGTGPSDAPTVVEAAPDRRNNAHLVLQPIEDLGRGSGSESPKYAKKKKKECEFHQASIHARIRSDEKWEDCRTKMVMISLLTMRRQVELGGCGAPKENFESVDRQKFARAIYAVTSLFLAILHFSEECLPRRWSVTEPSLSSSLSTQHTPHPPSRLPSSSRTPPPLPSSLPTPPPPTQAGGLRVAWFVGLRVRTSVSQSTSVRP